MQCELGLNLGKGKGCSLTPQRQGRPLASQPDREGSGPVCVQILLYVLNELLKESTCNF